MTNANEEWAPALGFEALYEVSTLGNVRRIATYKGKAMSRPIRPQLQATGYLRFWLSKDSQHTKIMAHRLVWSSFRGPIPNALVINHINGDKADNRIGNLELATQAANVAHSLDVLKCVRCHGSRHHNAKLTEADVVVIRALRKEGHTLKSISDRFGVHLATVGKIFSQGAWLRAR